MFDQFGRQLDSLVDLLRDKPRGRKARPRATKAGPKASVGLELHELDGRVTPATFTVTNANDVGIGSLRDAITQANLNTGPDDIQFNIGGGGKQVIALASQLPDITDTLTIDGTTQPGFAGSPIVMVDGASSGAAVGFQLTGHLGSTIRGLSIGNINGAAVNISVGAGGVTVAGNYIGVDLSGAALAPNLAGVVGGSGAGGDTIGGPAAADRNVISGNSGAGVSFNSSASFDGPLIQGNYIGTDANGSAAVANGGAGVDLTASGGLSGGVIVSGTRVIGNVIAGNTAEGVRVTAAAAFGFPADIPGAVIQGNLIGINAAGTVLGNDTGVFLQGVSSTLIGGPNPADRNVISGSKNGPGVQYTTNQTGTIAGPTIQNNYIGTNAAGTFAFGNNTSGVLIDGALGTATGVRIIGNLISGNTGDGLVFAGSAGAFDAPGAVVQGNKIGTTAVGQNALPNLRGVVATNVSGLQLGGPGAGQGNVISGNQSVGVTLIDSTGATIQGNIIGATANGATALPNASGGVAITASTIPVTATVGGTSAGAGNLVVQSGAAPPSGLTVTASGGQTAQVTIQGNRIANFPNGIQFVGGAAVNGGLQPPVLASAGGIPGGVRLTGTLTAQPNASYTVEFFSDQNFATVLGSQTVTTDAAGVAALSFDAAGTFPAGTRFSAIATDLMAGSSVYAAAVTATNAAPVANPDSYTTPGGTPLTVAAPGVLANDTDPDGNPLTARLVTNVSPAAGVLAFASDGSFTFTPAAGFVGTATFTYVANDGIVDSNVATVTITVTARPPVANPDAYTTAQGQTLAVPAPGVLQNDTSPDGGTLTAQLVSQPPAGQGTVVLNADGSFVFTPAAGFTGTVTFTYRAVATGVASAPATVTVQVTSAQTPVAVDDTFTVRTGQTLTVAGPGVLANDTGIPGQPLTAQLVTGPDPATGSLVLNADGSFVFTPAAGFVGTTSFTYVAVAGTGTGAVASAPATVTIRVTSNPLHAIGVGAGGAPRVVVYDQDGTEVTSLNAFEPTFTGGVRVAVADVTGDGQQDILAGAGFGGGSRVVLFDGVTRQPTADFFAFPDFPDYRGGVFVAGGDVTGDGKAEVVVGTGSGSTFGGLGSLVRMFDETGRQLAEFRPFEGSFSGGARVAVGDLNGDGRADIVVGAGLSGGPRVVVFSGADGSILASFFAFDPTYRGGVFVSIGGPPDAPFVVVTPDSSTQFAGTFLAQTVNAEGDGTATDQQLSTVLTTPPTLYQFYLPLDAAGNVTGATLAARVDVLSSSFLGGVRVAGGAYKDRDGVFVSAGSGGQGRTQFFPLVNGAISNTPTLDEELIPDPTFVGSVYVGATR